MESNYFDEERYKNAQKKVRQIKGFYWHLFWYIVVNIFLLVRIYLKSNTNEEFFELNHFSTAFFWGIGLFFHWITVFGKGIFFTKNWEEQKIKEYMEKDDLNN